MPWDITGDKSRPPRLANDLRSALRGAGRAGHTLKAALPLPSMMESFLKLRKSPEGCRSIPWMDSQAEGTVTICALGPLIGCLFLL